MIYSIHEDSERLRNINFRDGNNASWKPKETDKLIKTIFYSTKDGKDIKKFIKDNNDERRKQVAYNSGNTMESLAKTNPELFNNTKLKALQASENLVKDFNEYMASVYGNDIDRFGRFVESIKTERNYKEIEKQFKTQFNQSFHVALYERYKDLMERGVDEKEAARIASSEYFPESLDEEGIRKAINLRIANNRCLTDNLTVMLRQNYALLNLSKAEAEALIQDLGDDNTNNEAIGQIKQFLQNPELLEKFRMGKNNYDFRPIGGAVLFMSADNDVQFSEHPSKNLAWIFKYDAIVSGHGSSLKGIEYDDNEERYEDRDSDAANTTAKDIINSNRNFRTMLNDIAISFSIMNKDVLSSKVIIKGKPAFTKCYYNFSDFKTGKLRLSTNQIKNLLLTARNQIAKYAQSESKNKSLSEQEITKAMNLCYKAYQTRYSTKNPEQAIKDGASANWTIQPISTETQSNLTRVIDVVRALKAEGFKNILISSCNPGGIELPKDIRNSSDFKVTYATSSILKEEYIDPDLIELEMLEEQLNMISLELNSPYRNMSINELYAEYDALCIQYPINESIIDKLKEFAKKAWQIIVELWRRIINFVKMLIQKIKELFVRTFSKHANTKFEHPIEVHCITLSGDKAAIITQKAIKPLDIEKAFSNSNRSLEYAIQHHAKREMQYMKQYNDTIELNKAIDQRLGIKREFTIFEGIVLI